MGAKRVAFLQMAAFFQGGLFILALLMGQLLGISPWNRCSWTLASLSLGALATIPMLLFLVFIYRSKATCLVRVQTIVREILGRQIAACGWLDLVAVALLAGISEEFLFRGVLESYFSQWGLLTGLILCNVLFGLCHAVTPTYALLAMMLGCYLSLTLRFSSEPNLVVPIISHSLYDLAAFGVIRNAYCRNDAHDLPDRNGQRPIKGPLDSPSDPGRL